MKKRELAIAAPATSASEAPSPPPAMSAEARTLVASAEIAEMKKLAAELLVGARVKNTAAATMLAEMTAMSFLRLRSMFARQAGGDLPVEEARTIPAMTSGIKRSLQALGHVDAKLLKGEPAEEAEGFRPPTKESKNSAGKGSRKKERKKDDARI